MLFHLFQRDSEVRSKRFDCFDASGLFSLYDPSSNQSRSSQNWPENEIPDRKPSSSLSNILLQTQRTISTRMIPPTADSSLSRRQETSIYL